MPGYRLSVGFVAVRWSTAVLDLVTLVLFVTIGRATHHDGETVAGLLSTIWPFAAGLVAGWWAARRMAPTSVRNGVTVVVAMVALGMVLRVVAGQGTAPAFVGVAVGFDGLLMLGGRMLLRWGARLGDERALRG